MELGFENTKGRHIPLKKSSFSQVGMWFRKFMTCVPVSSCPQVGFFCESHGLKKRPNRIQSFFRLVKSPITSWGVQEVIGLVDNYPKIVLLILCARMRYQFIMFRSVVTMQPPAPPAPPPPPPLPTPPLPTPPLPPPLAADDVVLFLFILR